MIVLLIRVDDSDIYDGGSGGADCGVDICGDGEAAGVCCDIVVVVM